MLKQYSAVCCNLDVHINFIFLQKLLSILLLPKHLWINSSIWILKFNQNYKEQIYIQIYIYIAEYLLSFHFF